MAAGYELMDAAIAEMDQAMADAEMEIREARRQLASATGTGDEGARIADVTRGIEKRRQVALVFANRIRDAADAAGMDGQVPAEAMQRVMAVDALVGSPSIAYSDALLQACGRVATARTSIATGAALTATEIAVCKAMGISRDAFRASRASRVERGE